MLHGTCRGMFRCGKQQLVRHGVRLHRPRPCQCTDLRKIIVHCIRRAFQLQSLSAMHRVGDEDFGVGDSFVPGVDELDGRRSADELRCDDNSAGDDRQSNKDIADFCGRTAVQAVPVVQLGWDIRHSHGFSLSRRD